MNRWTRLAAAAGAVVVAVVLFVVLRPDDDGEEAEPTPAGETQQETTTGETTTEEGTTEETADATTEEATTEEAPTTTEAGPPPPRRVQVVVADGSPVGGVKRAQVEQGDRVVLIVRSNVSDHIHLHGYDLLADVAPGQQARIQFRATVPGRFEIELEDRGVLIAELEVR